MTTPEILKSQVDELQATRITPLTTSYARLSSKISVLSMETSFTEAVAALSKAYKENIDSITKLMSLAEGKKITFNQHREDYSSSDKTLSATDKSSAYKYSPVTLPKLATSIKIYGTDLTINTPEELRSACSKLSDSLQLIIDNKPHLRSTITSNTAITFIDTGFIFKAKSPSCNYSCNGTNLMGYNITLGDEIIIDYGESVFLSSKSSVESLASRLESQIASAERMADDQQAQYHAILQELKEAQIEERFNKAALLTLEGDHDGAISLLKQLAEEKVDLDFIHIALGRSLLLKSDLAESLVAFEKAESINPTNEDALLGKAQALQKQGSLERAKYELNKAIEMGAKSPEVFHLKLAEILELEENFTEALTQLDEVEKISPEMHQTNFLRSKALFELKNPEEALVHIKKAIEISKDSAEYYILQGLIYESMDGLDKALESFDNAIAIDPALKEAYIEKSFCLAKMGKASLALEEITKLPSGIEHYKILYVKAVAEKEQSHFQAAKDLMTAAISKCSKSEAEEFKNFAEQIDDIIGASSTSAAAASSQSAADAARSRVSFSAEDSDAPARRMSSSFRKSITIEDDDEDDDFLNALDSVLEEALPEAAEEQDVRVMGDADS